jgi:hypothetical protein
MTGMCDLGQEYLIAHPMGFPKPPWPFDDNKSFADDEEWIADIPRLQSAELPLQVSLGQWENCRWGSVLGSNTSFLADVFCFF